MSWHGDIKSGDSVDLKFTTVDATGLPATLGGTPVVSAYEQNSLTQITAGITLTTDFDSVTGLNHVRIAATTGNGYEAGKDYQLVITTGTVDGNSVVGYVVGSFSVEHRAAFKKAADVETDTQDIQGRLPTALVGGKMDSDAVALAGSTQSATDLKDFADAGYDPATNKVQGVVLVDTCTANTDMRGTDSALLASSYTAPNNTGIASILEDTGTTLPAQISALNNLSAAQVNAEVLDVISVDTFSLPGQGAPPATPTFVEMASYNYKFFRNPKESDNTETRLFNDAGTVVDQKSTDSFDGTVFTAGKMGSGA